MWFDQPKKERKELPITLGERLFTEFPNMEFAIETIK